MKHISETNTSADRQQAADKVAAEDILAAMTMHQHLHPHDCVEHAVGAVAERAGVCPRAVTIALAWLGLEGSVKFGRLRRTELTQLARSIHRIWQEAERAQDIERTVR